MKTQQHTGGKWRTVRNLATKKEVETLHENTQIHSAGRLIAVMFGGVETEANARLIAAAPEMLDALQYIKETLLNQAIDNTQPFDSELKIINAAINKATE